MNGTHAITHAIPHTELVSYRVESQGLVVKAGLSAAACSCWRQSSACVRARDAVGRLPARLPRRVPVLVRAQRRSIWLTMLHHLTGGPVGDVMRPLLETGARGVC
jgi:hypothetical protein